MNDLALLFAALQADPLNRNRALVLADAYDEAGHPELAALTRLGCEPADPDTFDQDAWVRQREFLTAFRAYWAARVPLSREVHLRSLPRFGQPVVEVKGLPVLAQIRPALDAAGLRWVHLGAQGRGGFRDPRRRCLAGLTLLDLRGCRLGPDEAAALADGDELAGVRVLLLRYSRLGPAGLAVLLAAPPLAGVQALDLGHLRLGGGYGRPWAFLGGLPALTELRLGTAGLLPEDLGDVLAGLGSPRVVRLDLSDNPLGRAGAEALAASPAVGRVAELDLRGCRLYPAAAAALVQSPHLGAGLVLDVRRNPLDGSAAAALRERFGAGVRLDES